MNELVRGKNVELMIITGGSTEHNLICAKSCTITKEWEMIPATTVSSGASREFRPRRYEWAMSVEGITTTETLVGSDYTFFDMLANSGTVLAMQMTFVDDNSDTKTLTGNAYIVSLEADGDVADFSNYSIQFQGTGVLTIA